MTQIFADGIFWLAELQPLPEAKENFTFYRITLVVRLIHTFICVHLRYLRFISLPAAAPGGRWNLVTGGVTKLAVGRRTWSVNSLKMADSIFMRGAGPGGREGRKLRDNCLPR